MRVIGYTEVQELGTGSQGRVALARSDVDASLVAIKYLPPEAIANSRKAATFRREARILSQLDNPHIARLHHYIEADDGAAIVMEAISGASLRALLDASDTGLTPEAALLLLKGSLLGLAAAHAAGVVHRDYKPANVMVQPDGNSKLIDFGIAVLAGHQGRAGTPAYMAPEQWRGEPASPATDVYAATCVFYECVTRRRPFGDDVTTLEESHLSAPVPARDIPRPLRPLLTTGMAKTPDGRPATADAFVADLETAATHGYGPDWEQRGRAALRAAAVALAAVAPFAVATAATAAVQHTAQSVLGRLIHSKAAAAAAGTATTAAVVLGYLLYPSDPPPPAVTFAQARAILANYLAVSNQANNQLDIARLSQVEAQPAIDMDAAYFAFSRQYHLGPVKPTDIRQPQFWIPRIAGNGKRWFVVHTGPGSTVAWTWYSDSYVADDPGAGLTRPSANSTLVFARQDDGAWKLSLIVDPPAASTAYPRPVLDSHGYAQEVSPNATDYAMTPRAIPAAITGRQAETLFARGTCSQAPQTPTNASQPPAPSKIGWALSYTATPNGLPVYGLKAHDSALIWVTTTQTTVSYRTDPHTRWRKAVPYTGVKATNTYFYKKLTTVRTATGVVIDPVKTPNRAPAKPSALACGGAPFDYGGT